ncbi:hypothetical protein FQA39_LY19220 [Lamprigera yunnana]|nr:hypothetical protein FQA39_LY19220 [Lamprigera yunnana]
MWASISGWLPGYDQPGDQAGCLGGADSNQPSLAARPRDLGSATDCEAEMPCGPAHGAALAACTPGLPFACQARRRRVREEDPVRRLLARTVRAVVASLNLTRVMRSKALAPHAGALRRVSTADATMRSDNQSPRQPLATGGWGKGRRQAGGRVRGCSWGCFLNAFMRLAQSAASSRLSTAASTGPSSQLGGRARAWAPSWAPRHGGPASGASSAMRIAQRWRPGPGLHSTAAHLRPPWPVVLHARGSNTGVRYRTSACQQAPRAAWVMRDSYGGDAHQRGISAGAGVAAIRRSGRVDEAPDRRAWSLHQPRSRRCPYAAAADSMQARRMWLSDVVAIKSWIGGKRHASSCSLSSVPGIHSPTPQKRAACAREGPPTMLVTTAVSGHAWRALPRAPARAGLAARLPPGPGGGGGARVPMRPAHIWAAPAQRRDAPQGGPWRCCVPDQICKVEPRKQIKAVQCPTAWADRRRLLREAAPIEPAGEEHMARAARCNSSMAALRTKRHCHGTAPPTTPQIAEIAAPVRRSAHPMAGDAEPFTGPAIAANRSAATASGSPAFAQSQCAWFQAAAKLVLRGVNAP